VGVFTFAVRPNVIGPKKIFPDRTRTQTSIKKLAPNVPRTRTPNGTAPIAVRLGLPNKTKKSNGNFKFGLVGFALI